MDKLGNQPCPMCKEKTLTLSEDEKDIPYFGKVYIFSMSCSNCKYHKADIEAAEEKEPCKYAIEVSGEEETVVGEKTQETEESEKEGAGPS